MSVKPPLRQGQMDGLCGLYAIMNFCLEKSLFDKSHFGKGIKKEAEWYVFEAVEMEGLLNTYYLYYGFEVQHIFSIFRRLCENLRIPYRPVYLDTLGSDPEQAVTKVLHAGGAVVGGFDGNRHWVLVHSKSDRKYLVHDSAASGTQITALGQARMKRFSMEAVALVPEKSLKEIKVA